MATEQASKNGWTITHDIDNGGYTLECKDNNFDSQTKTITMDTADKSMDGNVVITVKAKTANISINKKYLVPTCSLDATNRRIQITGSVTNDTTLANKGWIEQSSDIANNSTEISASSSSSSAMYFTIRLASVTAAANGTTSNVSVYNSGASGSNYLRVAATTSFTLTANTTGWYTGGSYSAYCSSVGEIWKNNLSAIVTISGARSHTGGGRTPTNNRYREVLNPNAIYIVCSDSVSFYVNSSGDTTIWSKTGTLDGGAIIFYDRETGLWSAFKHNSQEEIDRTAQVDDTTTREKYFWISTDKYIREINIASGFYDVYYSTSDGTLNYANYTPCGEGITNKVIVKWY